jgi:hypothetical protein
MCGMAVEYKNCISPSILAYGWHGGSDVLIGSSILGYGWNGGRVQEWHMAYIFVVWVSWRSVQEWYKSIHFGVCVAWRSRIMA